MRHLPSIQTLRAFEAAGRHQSYSRAAAELGLTHGAISHRIRELEAATGTKLFERRGNSMTPTREGHRLLVQIRHALVLLESAFSGTAKAVGGQRLTVSLLPAFAVRWLLPRLGEFRAAHLEVEFELRTSTELAPVGPGGVDAAIRYGLGGWPGVSAVHLADEILFPVCSPAYRDRLGLASPADLASATLLGHAWQPWVPWFRAAGVTIEQPVGGPTFADADLLLSAAVQGQGVALARGLLAIDDLRAGRLVRPFAATVPDAYAYHLVVPQAGPRSSALQVFQEWLQGAFKADVLELAAYASPRD